MIQRAPLSRRLWFVAPTRAGRVFQCWMIFFLAATASIVSGAIQLDPVRRVLAIHGLELLTVVALWLTYQVALGPCRPTHRSERA